MHKIVLSLNPLDCASLASTNRLLNEFMKPIVPGLKLRLFRHQLHALERMKEMETKKDPVRPMPLLKRLNVPGGPDVVLAVDLVDGSVLRLGKMPSLHAPMGGLFCDEPGLGKTITSLSLVLKTLGQMPAPPVGCQASSSFYNGKELKWFAEEIGGRYVSYGDDIEQKIPTRRARLFPHLPSEARRSSTRKVRRTTYFQKEKGVGSVPTLDGDVKQTVFLSHATLIIVPSVLTQHWLHQIQMHVKRDVLNVLHVASAKHLPKSIEDLASSYDVVLVSFDVIGHLANEMREEAPMLMRIHFLRIIVDEGHKLSAGNLSQFANACARLRSERRWVMTGTPVPSTLKSDVDHLYSLLMFIREEAFGFDKKAWQVGIRDPYSQYRKESLELLCPLLKEVMIRADKSILPSKLHNKNVLLDFTKESAESYNWLVSLTRRNLITADWFSEKHVQSLLNKKNLKLAQAVVKNLRYASCFGGTQQVIFTEKDVIGTVDILYENFKDIAKVKDSDRFDDPALEWPLLSLQDVNDEEVRQKQRELKRRTDMFEGLIESGGEYLRLTKALKAPLGGKAYVSRIYSGVLHDVAEAFLSRQAHCACCHKPTAIPMITPCAHLLCENCVILDREKCTAQHCGIPYRLDKDGIPEDLIEMQPSAYSPDGWMSDWSQTRSAKITYLIDRIQKLEWNEEWIPGETEPRRYPPKVIVHSSFTDHLKLVAMELKESNLRDSYVEMWKNDAELDTELKQIKRASVFAQRSISKFATDPSKHILLMNTRQGSVGLDLSFVECIFLMEPVWDASVELQITSRAHRIGSKKDIYVERLVMRDSVEHEMLKELDSQLQAGSPGIALEKAQKDLSRCRSILRNLKPVAYVEEQKTSVKRKGEDLNDRCEEAGELSRKVRFRTM